MSFPNLKSTFVVSLCFMLFAGCTSDVKRVQLPANANANEEITQLETELGRAQAQQIDVASPVGWKHANEALTKAKSLREKGEAQSEVLLMIGESKAAINDAEAKAIETRKLLFDIFSVREQARIAQAEKFYTMDLQDVDADLIKVTANYENKEGSISSSHRETLRLQYSELELKSLKVSYLGPVRNMLELAEKNQASKYAPKSLEIAKAKLRNAEAIISDNRNDIATIQVASNEAKRETEKLLRVTKEARVAKGLSAEDMALSLDNKNAELAEADVSLNNSERNVKAQSMQMREQDSLLFNSRKQNSNLKSKDAFNESFVQAQKDFPREDAELYRQGDKLLIRLKSVNFISGRSDLPYTSYPALNHVKDLISSMKAQQIEIGGHTDSLGGKELNQKLSQDRAESVKHYLASTQVISAEQISAEGFGYEKPLATNKTEQGRSQNRRVDILITPAKAVNALE